MDRTAPSREHPLHNDIVDTCLSYGPMVQSITVSPLAGRSARVLSVTGTLGVLIGRDLEITVWSGTRSGATSKAAEPPTWIRLAVTEKGKTEEIVARVGSADSIELEDEDERDYTQGAMELLLDLLDLVGEDHAGLSGAALVNHYVQLNAACLEGLRLAREEVEAELADVLDFYDEDDDQEHSHARLPHREDWYGAVDNFTDQCRYGFLRHLALQESPYGAADVSALIRPPGMDTDVTVKVFTHRGKDEPLAGHWYAAEDGMCSAHGEDVDIVGLVAGYPIESQGFIAHSLEHLHTTAHTVETILQARMDGIVEALRPVLGDGEPHRDLVKALYSAEFADTIAGLNGIARLHTGAARGPGDS